MESTESEIKVILRSPQDQRAPGVVTLLEWSRRQRLLRAAKTLGLCWAAALVSVLIPLAHFVLVPALIIAGPIASYLIYHRERIISGGTGSCPKCESPFTVVKSPVKWPLNDLCSNCQTPVSIDAEQQP